MIRRFLKWGLSLVKSAVDESVPEEQLHAYLRRRLVELKDQLEVGAIPSFLAPIFIASQTKGILGTQLLETYIIQLDVSRGEMRFLEY